MLCTSFVFSTYICCLCYQVLEIALVYSYKIRHIALPLKHKRKRRQWTHSANAQSRRANFVDAIFAPCDREGLKIDCGVKLCKFVCRRTKETKIAKERRRKWVACDSTSCRLLNKEIQRKSVDCYECSWTAKGWQECENGSRLVTSLSYIDCKII